MHPLPSDVIGLDVDQLVHKLQCEAADAVRAQYHGAHFTGQVDALTSLQKQIKDAGPGINDAYDALKKGSDFGQTELELLDAKSSVALQSAQLDVQVATLLADTVVTVDVKEKRRLALVNEYSRLEALMQSINDSLKRRKIYDEKIAAREKLSQQIKDNYSGLLAFQSHIVVFNFILQATEENNATSNGSVAWPVAFGSLKLIYDVGDQKKRVSDRRVKLASSFKELQALPCDGSVQAIEDRRALRYPITGTVGLDEVFVNYLSLVYKRKQRLSAGGESYSDKITFTTTLNGSLEPSISIAKFPTHIIGAEANLTAKRIDTHELTVYLTPPETEKSGSVQEMVISSMPALRVRGHVARLPPNY